jgi:hypothetical protein
MRASFKQIVSSVFGVAILIIIVEHAGGFSEILNTGSGAFSTGFQALTGHAGGSKGVATGFVASKGGVVVK